jgi:hypothetical protein
MMNEIPTKIKAEELQITKWTLTKDQLQMSKWLTRAPFRHLHFDSFLMI